MEKNLYSDRESPMEQVDGVRRKMKIFHQNPKMIETNDNEKPCLWKRKSQNVLFSRACFVFTLILLIQIQFTLAVTRPREDLDSSMEAIALRYCDFLSTDRVYNMTNLVQCMNELASAAVSRSRVGRSSEDYFFPNPKKNQGYQSSDYQYPPRQTNDFQSYYERRPPRAYPDSAPYQQAHTGYYDGGSKYLYGSEQSYRLPGNVGARLFEALASISQYDDLKCVSRILCEVATGVIPGNEGYRQNYDGGNSLISLLTNLDIGEPSPLLSFGKSALMGYANRGNPSICYRQYPKCPRSSAELVNYLNNHNGGFFRFFGNGRGSNYQGSYYRAVLRRQPAPPPGISGPESDRTGTGELKFDSSGGSLGRDFMKSFFPEKKEYNESDKITFPQEPLQGQQSLNRVSKSLMPFSDPASDYQNPSFFPQDRNDPESNLLYSLNPSMQVQSRPISQITGSRKGRLYLPEDPTNETISTFKFPDGQRVQINVAFSKLFSENYSKALRRSFANDHGPEPVNFESFSIINLVELFPNDGARMDLQVVHPCDMVCHDSKGTPVQFSQILLHSRKLSTLMIPDQPTLDLSNSLPCEIICIDRAGEKRQLSTTLNQVLRIDEEQQPGLDVTGFQDDWQSRTFRSLNHPQRTRYKKNRKVRQNINQSQQGRQRSQEFNIDRGLPPMPSKDQNTNGEFHSHFSEPRDINQNERRANSVRRGGKRSFMPGQPFAINNRRSSYMGRSMPFMGMSGFLQKPPFLFPPRAPNPFGLGFPSGMGMMPIYPGFMPPLRPPIRPVPPKIICSTPECLREGSSIRILRMCGGKLSFIPPQMFVILPVCAIIISNGASTSSEGQVGTSLPHHKNDTAQPGNHPEVGNHPGLGQNPEVGDHPELGQHPDGGAVPGLGQPSGAGAHPALGQNPEVGAHPALGQSPQVEPHPGLGQYPEVGAHPALGQSPQVEPHPGLGQYPEAGAHPGPGQSPQVEPHPGLGQYPEVGAHPGPGERPELAEHAGVGEHHGEHLGPGEHQGYTEHQGFIQGIRPTTSYYSDSESTISNMQGLTPPTFTDPIHGTVVGSTHKFRPPEGEDYPQQSCLEGEFWNLDTHECVPIKYDPDIDLDYTHLPGSPWSGVTRKPLNKHRLRKKKKKLVLISDKGNITYIKTT